MARRYRYGCVAACVFSLWAAFALPARAYETALPMPAQGTLQAAFSPWDDVEGLIGILKITAITNGNLNPG